MTEGPSSGLLLGTLQAKDPDEGENGTVFYSLSGTVAAENKESTHLSNIYANVVYVVF